MAQLIDPSEHSGKSRAQRIRLDYFRGRSHLQRNRRIAVLVASVAAVSYLAWIGLAPGGTGHLSSGRVSAAHASFEQNCALCHVDFVPIAADAWKPDPQAAVAQTSAKCLACHTGIDSHSDGFNAAGQLVDRQCSGCHSEHRGREHRLIPGDDRSCVDCHRDVTRFHDGLAAADSQPPIRVSGFSATDHGDFRSLDRDENSQPSRIAFDHALHMLPGQVEAGRRGGMTLDRLPPEHRQRYQRLNQSDESIVQLQCADCHRFESGSAGRVRSGDFDWGRHSLPIRFDQHCIACHPLTTPGQSLGQAVLTHGVPLRSLQESIRRQVAGIGDESPHPESVRRGDDPPVRDLSKPPPAAGNSGPGRESPLLAAVTRQVAQQCQLCHRDEDLNSLDRLPAIPQPNLRAGRYDHGAHRTVACVACHPAADPEARSVAQSARPALSDWWTRDDGIAGRSVAESMIVGLTSCTPCHRSTPAAAESIDPTVVTAAPLAAAYRSLFGGLADRAPGSCTTCHQYHSSGHSSLPDVSPLDVSVSGESQPAAVPPLMPTPAAASSPTSSDSGATVTTFVTAPFVEPAKVGHWLGSDSCATSTCHGGPLGPTVDWNSSQTVFNAFDPHVGAGSVLESDRSRRIVEMLDPATRGSEQRFSQLLRERCNGCHAPLDAAGNTLHPSLISVSADVTAGDHQGRRGEGVSCEACHGPAGGWLESHLRDDWSIGGGMKDHSRFVTRVENCVSCHVGSRRADGVVRDMNHDMIAAGHPALRFEPWSALRRLPAHGGTVESSAGQLGESIDRSDDGLPRPVGEAELRRFLAGRTLALRAAIRLTAERFADARGGKSDSVWPELADYDCFACHHQLQITNFARRPSAGFPQPHPWLQTGLIDSGLHAVASEDAASLRSILDTFRLRAAGGAQIASAARQAETILDRFLARLQDPRPLPAELVTEIDLVADPVADHDSDTDADAGAERLGSEVPDWYDAAYWYLRSHVRLRDSAAGRDRGGDEWTAQRRAAIADAFDVLGDQLQLGRVSTASGFRSDSPADFDASNFRQAAQRLTELLEKD